jgi:ATP-dependent DNA helicase RecG
MEIIELLEILGRGEDSRHQFKKNVTNADSLASDMVAFSNGGGGLIVIGVNDDGTVTGLTGEDVRRLNQLISNAASQNVQPAINPVTENIRMDCGLLMLVDIPAGLNKPYQDKNGVFLVKCGSDKRRATSREEIQRMFQASSLVHADVTPVPGTTVADLDIEYFRKFFQKRFIESLGEQNIPLPDILRSMNLLKNDCLNICGVLLFAKEPQYKLLP